MLAFHAGKAIVDGADLLAHHIELIASSVATVGKRHSADIKSACTTMQLCKILYFTNQLKDRPGYPGGMHAKLILITAIKQIGT